MSVPTNVCNRCKMIVEKGGFSDHNKVCVRKSAAPVGGGGGNNSNGPEGPEKSSAAASSGGGGHEVPVHPPVVSGSEKKSKGPKAPEKSSAAASVGGGQADPVTTPLVGSGGGKKSKAPKGTEDSSAAASSGGGGSKGSAKAAPAPEDLTLIAKAIAQNIPGFTFVNIGGMAIKVSGVCAHMVQGPGFSCTVDGCTGKLLKGGSCFTTATGILFAVVEPKTADNNRAYWRKPTAAEISLLKMPVAATAAAGV